MYSVRCLAQWQFGGRFYRESDARLGAFAVGRTWRSTCAASACDGSDLNPHPENEAAQETPGAPFTDSGHVSCGMLWPLTEDLLFPFLSSRRRSLVSSSGSNAGSCRRDRPTGFPPALFPGRHMKLSRAQPACLRRAASSNTRDQTARKSGSACALPLFVCDSKLITRSGGGLVPWCGCRRRRRIC
jgi:hypothetical protein